MKKMIMAMIGFSIVVYGIGLFITTDILAWTVGIALGLVIAILKLRLMENALHKAVTMEENKAKGYTQRQYIIRYILTGVLLVVAVMNPYVSIVGVFVGLLSMKAGAYAALYGRH